MTMETPAIHIDIGFFYIRIRLAPKRLKSNESFMETPGIIMIGMNNGDFPLVIKCHQAWHAGDSPSYR